MACSVFFTSKAGANHEEEASVARRAGAALAGAGVGRIRTAAGALGCHVHASHHHTGAFDDLQNL